MSDEARALRRAIEVWRESRVDEHEIRAGAERIARRFAVRRRALSAHKVWVLAGATAAFLGTLAYAGRGAWIEPAPRDRRPAIGDHAPVPIEPRPNVLPVDPPAPPQPAQTEPAPPQPAQTKLGIPMLDTPRAPPIARPESRENSRGPEPTWTDVSDALAARDQDRAEKLLIELATRGHDANTRAKAHLGLAQLDEARDDCGAARSRALKAASMPDIEIKTVRRALELAARCSR